MEFLRQIPIFSGLTKEQLESLANISVLRNYPKGTVIFNPSQKAEGFYALKSGKVKIYRTNRGKEQIIRIFTAPAFFGEAAGFMGSNFPAWAEAIEDSEVVFIPRKAFIQLMKVDPEIAMRLMAVMAQRLVYLTNVIESLSLKDALSKVASYILRQAQEKEGEEFVFRTNLAAMELGLTKETVSRMLSRLKSLGAIEKSGSKVKIKNLKLLKDLAV
ncbi:Crp/Fnr family transcriptional regulator [Phorcysia thermohydrogeniphila]|uniref:CRP/FNR family transcriptional regulator n=1 Tax=Phorcysia thermohydrogeniphila TaxID=936138 RepID=A0A4R1G6N8_9BACT|nr:Crp/Fnr family transcriptional regulator [Phorcysia thermohydrogeniphila]TCK03354.1 CRP/FNR family transcriptional regulator [Phorcysia thermohydrogeniphila]